MTNKNPWDNHLTGIDHGFIAGKEYLPVMKITIPRFIPDHFLVKVISGKE